MSLFRGILRREKCSDNRCSWQKQHLPASCSNVTILCPHRPALSHRVRPHALMSLHRGRAGPQLQDNKCSHACCLMMLLAFI